MICFRLNPNFESASVESSNCFSGASTKFGIDEEEYVDSYINAINLLKKSMTEDEYNERITQFNPVEEEAQRVWNLIPKHPLDLWWEDINPGTKVIVHYLKRF